MTFDNINVDEALERVRQPLEEGRSVSPALRVSIDVLMTWVKLMSRLSRTASSAPSSTAPA